MKNLLIIIILLTLSGCATDKTSFGSSGEKAEVKDIQSAFQKKYPNYSKESQWALDIAIDSSTNQHAMGTAVADAYKDGIKKHWFAAKVNNQWLITDEGSSYFGSCQNFQNYHFPTDMIPDCWDEAKNVLVETANFNKFFLGLDRSDRVKLKQAYLDYVANDPFYQNHDIFIKIDHYQANYLFGTALISGIENRSRPYFLAVRDGDNWKVIYSGQEEPPCKNLAGYNIPVSAVKSCFENNQLVERR